MLHRLGWWDDGELLMLAATTAQPGRRCRRTQSLLRLVADGSLNLECARDEGLNGLQFTGADQLRRQLHGVGVLK